MLLIAISFIFLTKIAEMYYYALITISLGIDKQDFSLRIQ